MNVKKWVGRIFVAFVLYLIVVHPATAADITRNGGTMLKNGADSTTSFIERTTK